MPKTWVVLCYCHNSWVWNLRRMQIINNYYEQCHIHEYCYRFKKFVLKIKSINIINVTIYKCYYLFLKFITAFPFSRYIKLIVLFFFQATTKNDNLCLRARIKHTMSKKKISYVRINILLHVYLNFFLSINGLLTCVLRPHVNIAP